MANCFVIVCVVCIMYLYCIIKNVLKSSFKIDIVENYANCYFIGLQVVESVRNVEILAFITVSSTFQ